MSGRAAVTSQERLGLHLCDHSDDDNDDDDESDTSSGDMSPSSEREVSGHAGHRSEPGPGTQSRR